MAIIVNGSHRNACTVPMKPYTDTPKTDRIVYWHFTILASRIDTLQYTEKPVY